FMLRRLLYLGKPALFISLLALEVVVLGAGGIAAFRWHKPVVIAVVLWLLVGFIVLPVLGRGVFDGRFDVAWTSLAAFGAYAFVLLLLDPEREKQPSPEPAGLPWSPGGRISRREMIGGGFFLLASAVLVRTAIGKLP